LKIPPPYQPPLSAVVREILHVSATPLFARALVTIVALLVVGAPVALSTSGSTKPMPPPPSPLEPAVPLLEASVDAGVPWFASIILGKFPKAPGPNQKREGQCDPRRSEVVINGGCWVETTHTLPCPEGVQFEHEGRCYLPVGPTVRPPTTGDLPPLSIADP
jgi:hypothetical protein